MGVISGALVGAAVSYGFTTVLDQYLKVPLLLKVKRQKREGKSHEYSGKQQIVEYWRDLLGPQFGLEKGAKRLIKSSDWVTFENVIITDFVPRAPGFYYSKNLWQNPRLAPISLGVVRVSPEKTSEQRLLALHRPLEYEAHADIEKGIPIIVSPPVYESLSAKLDKYGSVHIEKVYAKVSDLKAYSDYLRTADIPLLYPVVDDKNWLKSIGDPIPIMGNAWTAYRTPKTTNVLNFRFWAGVDYFDKSLNDAKVALEKLIPKNGWSLTNFDERIRHFMNDKLIPLNEIWKHIPN